MSCYVTTTIDHCDFTSFSVCSFLERIRHYGWDAGDPVIHTPLEADDEFVWETSPYSKALEVLRILDEHQTFAGVCIGRANGGSCTITFHWIKEKIEILWGADGPRHTEWPRVIDLGWAMRSLSEILVAAELEAEQIEFLIQTPGRPS